MANTHSIDLELSSSQYLSIADGDQTGLDLTTDFTLEIWIKLEQLPSTIGDSVALIGKDGAAGDRSWACKLTSANKLSIFYVADNDATNYTFIESTSAIVVAGDVGSWVHIAVSVDISAKTAVMYKNSSSVDDTVVTANSTTSVGSTAPFRIGTNRAADSDFFDGLIDEVRVWNDIRTPTEIADNYEKELAGTETGLVGYWQLNNDLLDQTSNDNDLTNNNSATFSTDVPFTGANTGAFFQLF